MLGEPKTKPAHRNAAQIQTRLQRHTAASPNNPLEPSRFEAQPELASLCGLPSVVRKYASAAASRGQGNGIWQKACSEKPVEMNVERCRANALQR